VDGLAGGLQERLARKLLRVHTACCQLAHLLLALSQRELEQVGLLAMPASSSAFSEHQTAGSMSGNAVVKLVGIVSTAGSLVHTALLATGPAAGSHDAAAAEPWDR